MKTQNVLIGTLVALAGVALIMGLMPVRVTGRPLALGAICAVNLSGLSKAMAIYAYPIDPLDGATGVPPQDVVLTWRAGQGAVLHIIYFGADLEAVAGGSLMAYQGTQSGTTLYVGDLASGQTYYWRVDEVDAYGAVAPGSVWSFTTRRFSPVL